MDKIMSRKLGIAVGLTILSSWLLLEGVLTGQVWSSFMSVNVIGYMMGNVGEHFAGKEK